MARTSPTPITALGTPPSTSDPTNFDTRADALFSQLPTTVTEINALGTVTYNNAVDAYNSATTAAADAASSAANAAIASAAAGAILWVSGTTYTVGDRRISPANGLIYRRTTAGAGTTDPSADTTNWTPVALNAPAQLVSALVHQAISGQCLALTNTTAQTSTTNSCLYSSDLSNAAWVKSGATVSTNVSMGPNGETTADKVVESATTGIHYFYQILTIPANVARTWSFFAKAAGRSTFVAEMDRDGNGVDMVGATFNLSTGTVSAGTNSGTGSGASATIVHVGNGWYFCTLSGTCSTSAGSLIRALIYVNVSASYTGDGVSGIEFGEMQIEPGSSATSRIPTTTVAVTRSAGVVAPQRIVLPASPSANAWVKLVVANGINTNVIDPNGQQLAGANGVVSGPIEMDNSGFSGALQFINGYWRFV